MYVSPNFKTKKDFKEAVAAGKPVNIIKPKLFSYIPKNGTVFIEGPHYPEPHKWCAEVTVKDSKIKGIK
ncbi:unnamed protein product [marine sediment metagenome]|uniref:Uncharacterized protein n=1 Tax=marine sediment metagenome TaxID=412755 RepID=X0SEJ4_9ZZZZ